MISNISLSKIEECTEGQTIWHWQGILKSSPHHSDLYYHQQSHQIQYNSLHTEHSRPPHKIFPINSCVHSSLSQPPQTHPGIPIPTCTKIFDQDSSTNLGKHIATESYKNIFQGQVQSPATLLSSSIIYLLRYISLIISSYNVLSNFLHVITDPTSFMLLLTMSSVHP